MMYWAMFWMFFFIQICNTESKQNLKLLFGKSLEIRDSVAKNNTKELEIQIMNGNDFSINVHSEIFEHKNESAPIEFLVRKDCSARHWALPIYQRGVTKLSSFQKFCPSESISIHVTTQNDFESAFLIKLSLSTYELSLGQKMENLPIEPDSNHLFLYQFQNQSEIVDFKLTVSNVSVCGHFYLMYAEKCYDNLIRNPTEQAQVMYRRKYMTFLEKAQTYMSADYGKGVLIMIFGYNDKMPCGDFNSSIPMSEVNSKLSLAVMKKEEGNIFWYSILVIALISIVVVLTSLIISFVFFQKKLATYTPTTPPSTGSLYRDEEATGFPLMLILIGIYYAIPAYEVALTYQKTYRSTGNLDLCYYNQGCLTDSTLYEDTSHIISNIVYSIIGIGFIFIVAVKNYQLSSKYKEIGNNGDATVYGVLFDTKLFYSLGLGAIGEAILSACYHICPSRNTFQYDTTFMFLISMLIILKLYRFRHFKYAKSTYKFYGLLLVITMIELLGKMIYHWINYALLTVVHLLIVGIAVWEIRNDHYSMGIKQAQLCKTPLLFCVDTFGYQFMIIINIGLAVATCYYRVPGLSGTIFVLLVVNMIIHTLHYVGFKLYYKAKGHEGESIGRTSLIHAAFVIAILPFAVWMYSKGRSSNTQSPAISRNRNADCIIGIFDEHDLWHLTSAFTMFFVFMFILTLEDDNIFTPRDQLPIF